VSLGIVRVLVLVGALVLGGGCRHAALPPGSYLSGDVVGLEETGLDRKDFVWTVGFSPDGIGPAHRIVVGDAYDSSSSQFNGWSRRTLSRGFDAIDLQVEALAFSPDGASVVTVEWDGTVKRYDAATGALRRVIPLEEPLTTVAFHPAGHSLVVGSARGLLTVLRAEDLRFVFEVRAHTDRVSALAFAPDGTLYSAGWDKSIRVWDMREEALRQDQVRVRFARREGQTLVLGNVNDRVALSFVVDARIPVIALDRLGAEAAGIDSGSLLESKTLPTALGSSFAWVALDQSLRFKGMVLKDVDLVVCDACVPSGTYGVLGAPFTERFDVVFDEATREAVFTAKTPVPAGAEAPRGWVLVPRTVFAYEAHVNDVTVDAKGQRLGVAFSEVRAERDREGNAHEQQGVLAPTSRFNAAALVEASTGRVLRSWTRHRNVVSSAAVSPDGRAVVSGGWDKQLYLWREGQLEPVATRTIGWPVRRVRFSPEGRHVGVATWAPLKVFGGPEREPAGVLFHVRYAAPIVMAR
jgi:WD domain, G-beta repeat